MADKMLGRIPQSTPEVSWFEFLLDKTGKLLKDHISTKNAGQFMLAHVWDVSRQPSLLGLALLGFNVAACNFRST